MSVNLIGSDIQLMRDRYDEREKREIRKQERRAKKGGSRA